MSSPGNPVRFRSRPITTLVADPNTVEIGSHPAQARSLRDGDLHPHHHSSPSARSDAE